MKLSMLVYNCVKNVILLDDSSFTYEFLVNSKFETDNRDYKTSLQNVFAPLNQAIHRLSDRDKIEHKTTELESPMKPNGVIDLDQKLPIKTICNVFRIGNGNYINIPFKKLSRNQLLITRPNMVNNEPLYIEYKEDIKNFTLDDVVNNDVDLREYGVNETMCSYIVEFCIGKLRETIDPSAAAYHNNLAEQYFDSLDTIDSSFYQDKITNVWSIN